MMQSPSKLSGPFVSTPSGVSGLQGWTDLPVDLLHSIIPLLGSYVDLSVFVSTCRSWRVAFLSYPSKSTLCTVLLPLLVQPNVLDLSPHLPSSNGRHELRNCKLIDLAKQNISLCCQIPRKTFENMWFVGSSYGHLICCLKGNFFIVDVLTGAEFSPPSLPLSCDFDFYYYGTLTARPASPNCHLLVSTHHSLFDWPIGSDSWSQLMLPYSRIDQIVEFNGQFIALDCHWRIYILKLAPQLGLEQITTRRFLDDMAKCPQNRWLVVCDDMLLIICYYESLLSSKAPVQYKPYRLDMSTRPAKWVEVKKLDNWALFVGRDFRSPSFSCSSPEQWGGWSNRLYYAHNFQPLTVHGLGDEAEAAWEPSTDPNLFYGRNRYKKVQAFWVYPSMFSSDG
ncbi:hypothetical protein CFC21_055366 [Triticum aestivum]|uniref:KIB1-4 beta-propeller domain-containing protein n=2 Tax=Triticum aestivum TaxID=4565 RepID=A0A9R1GFX5_WHEAT|nr:uncharacterized protein LOC123088378 [Triticum aestivum]KAF7046334.1 hypothetical protein CFC21_055366 [Triticum aestivum]